MALKFFMLLAALQCVFAGPSSPTRFAVTSWDNPAGPAVRIYAANPSRIGIQEWESDGDSSVNPQTYKTWHSSPVLTSVTTAANSAFAAVSDGNIIDVYFERDNGNGTTSLASAHWEWAAGGWSVGSFVAPSGSFLQGTSLAATMWAEGKTSVFFQGSSGAIYETVNTGSGWSNAELFALADLDTGMATFGFVNAQSVIKKYVYLQSAGQMYEYAWSSDTASWQVGEMPNPNTGGLQRFGVTSFLNSTTARLYYTSPSANGVGIGELVGTPDNWGVGSGLGIQIFPTSDMATTTQVLQGEWWTYIIFSATDGTLWQDTFTWSTPGNAIGWQSNQLTT